MARAKRKASLPRTLHPEVLHRLEVWVEQYIYKRVLAKDAAEHVADILVQPEAIKPDMHMLHVLVRLRPGTCVTDAVYVMTQLDELCVTEDADVVVDGVTYVLGDGDDSGACSITASSEVRIWLRAWPEAA